MMLVWTNLVLHCKFQELCLANLQEIEEEIEARGTFAVILLRQCPPLLTAHPLIANVDVHQMIRAPESTLDKLQVVSDTLHHALDFLVVVLRRNTFYRLAFPTKLSLNDLDMV